MCKVSVRNTLVSWQSKRVEIYMYIVYEYPIKPGIMKSTKVLNPPRYLILKPGLEIESDMRCR